MPLFIIILIIFFTGCQSAIYSDNLVAGSTLTNIEKTVKRSSFDTIHFFPELIYEKTEKLAAAPGTKSVLFNSSGSKLYAMNLEGMSVYEFDQPTRKIIREFKFKPTPGTGWDYVKEKPIPSFQEKPVEACLSHDDKILWVSLHNAGGIVPIFIDSIELNKRSAVKQEIKKITVLYPGTNKKDSFSVPLIKTGKTPKIISIHERRTSLRWARRWVR